MDKIQRHRKEHIFLQKLVFTGTIFFIYVIGKNIPLYGIDYKEILKRELNIEELFTHTISGDLYRYSILTLGVFPHMIASMIVQIIYSFKNDEEKKKCSKTKQNKISLVLTLIIAMIQASLSIIDLPLRETSTGVTLTVIVVFCEMVAGSIFILLLSANNKKYGIGGQSIIIIANIINSMGVTIQNESFDTLIIPAVVSFFVAIVTLFMENAEFRIPVQRVSIYSIYADKNYMAVKFNPVGVMPSMFATAVFILPQLFVSGLLYFFPGNTEIIWWRDRLSLTEPIGITVYLLILYLLTVGFSFLLLHPGEIADQFLKSGDSIVNIHVGVDTKKYLLNTLLVFSLLSATVMCICLGLPLYLQVYGKMNSNMMMLPASVMMLTGIWCSILREGKAIKNIEGYRTFI